MTIPLAQTKKLEKNDKKNNYVSTNRCCILVMSGCSAKGPQFDGFKEPAKGKSNVYVYRIGSFAGALTPNIHSVNLQNNEDVVIGSVKPNGCIMTTITPGMTKFLASTEVKNEVDLNANPNKIYCIKHYFTIGFIAHHPQFQIVDIEKCKNEIKETKLSLQD